MILDDGAQGCFWKLDVQDENGGPHSSRDRLRETQEQHQDIHNTLNRNSAPDLLPTVLPERFEDSIIDDLVFGRSIQRSEDQ